MACTSHGNCKAEWNYCPWCGVPVNTPKRLMTDAAWCDFIKIQDLRHDGASWRDISDVLLLTTERVRQIYKKGAEATKAGEHAPVVVKNPWNPATRK